MADRRNKSEITRAVLRWYRNNGRRLPWRGIRDPYRILVSEVMLQQTQVSRVLIKYPQFLKRFPSFKSLADAKASDAIKAWQGMGYNNRVIRLQQLARTIIKNNQGRLPNDINELQKLPGIGRYTAHAVACLVFHEQVPVVDTNIIRVLSRLFPKKLKLNRQQRIEIEAIWETAEWLLPRNRAADWNQALMDLGAMVCTAANPKCSMCPVQSYCPSAFKTIRATTKSLKQEPKRDGIPHRIYRGRIIEALRNLNGKKSITASELG
ncbi:MAG: A/G-specific adenine glycosylase, partial [Ignavibacteriales bacterium]|nr:A/G-specific adenine glycosylase [Ignavibacteriales bacterium]